MNRIQEIKKHGFTFVCFDSNNKQIASVNNCKFYVWQDNKMLLYGVNNTLFHTIADSFSRYELITNN